ncbi:MAG TPA: hypothetical protein VGR53_10920 [Nitrososphaerales archaeon]|nr:hypothetical protein [Nitrososphaerales archaeon]
MAKRSKRSRELVTTLAFAPPVFVLVVLLRNVLFEVVIVELDVNSVECCVFELVWDDGPPKPVKLIKLNEPRSMTAKIAMYPYLIKVESPQAQLLLS